ncbi:c-type cytochrome [Polymorphobacter sp.]|uniref:c-type cytochrome n=1 Tax=Polymorphobacter sp. TaxID=1909290 RepID=UPI003F7304CE
MRRAGLLLALLLVGAAAFWALTRPLRLEADQIADEAGADPTRGARLFWVGGCASCHAPSAARGDDRLKLAGGAALETKFGKFQAPNISSHPTDGIGGWSLADFANAMQKGVSPDGRHYYPAFPYSAYQRMTPADIADLYAYLKTMPAVAGKAPASDISFPYSLRRGIGLWKRAFMADAGPVVALPANASAAARHGQYLVEGPGHCAECHTPRSLSGLGGLDTAHWLAGAPAAEGDGKVPGIDPDSLEWSAAEIADYLKTGFTPEYDSVGGSMATVQRNLAELPDVDRAAIGAYLKALPEQVPAAGG